MRQRSDGLAAAQRRTIGHGLLGAMDELLEPMKLHAAARHGSAITS